MEEYIKLLDLNPEEFNLADLKKAYRKKVLQYHPDKAANEAERIGYEATMKKLNEANTYIKEYLENHGGKYSKSEYYNTNTSSDDDTADNTTEDNTYSDEEAEESSYEEENEEEETEDTEENPYDYIKDLSFGEQIIEICKIMFNSNKTFNVFKEWWKPFKDKPIQGIVALIICCYLGCMLVDKFIYPSNNSPQQETKQQEQVAQVQPTSSKQQTQTNNSVNDNNTEIDTNNNTAELDDTAEFGSYMRDIQRGIKSNWDLPRGMESHTATVSFTIYKDGRLIGEPTIKHSSNNNMYDISCVDAVKSAAPFNPFPTEITKDSLDIDFTFEDKKPYKK